MNNKPNWQNSDTSNPNLFDNSSDKRKLAGNIITVLSECESCIWQGDLHCWDYESWNQGLCCGFWDVECDSMLYCSDDMSDNVKVLSCPVSQYCPDKEDSEFILSEVGV